jgi:hypothetical protein
MLAQTFGIKAPVAGRVSVLSFLHPLFNAITRDLLRSLLPGSLTFLI